MGTRAQGRRSDFAGEPGIDRKANMATAKKRRKSEPETDTPPPAARPKIPGLSARPVWQGHLRLSLVSCPVALYKATSRANDISFNLINPETNNRIRMVPTDPETGPVNRADLVRGYEIEKNRYVIIEPEELDAVKLETTHTLDIERFVDADSIDRLFFDEPYVLLPTDDIAAQAYAVIREAMSHTNRVALGRVVMHTRERLMAIEPRDNGLLTYSLRMRDEVVNMAKALESIPDVKPDRQMIEIAEKIIAQFEGPFDPEQFNDRYEKALRDLIRRKEQGEKPAVVAPPAEPSNVIDLMAALKKSLGSKGAAAKTAPPKHATASHKTAKKRAK
jgi:DNA end-binding protein Ku